LEVGVAGLKLVKQESFMTATTETTGTLPTLAEFHGTSISIIERDGQKWLTAEQAGRALGYSADLARISTIKLYNRHEEEFTDAETCVVKLTTGSRGEQRTRIFSATGCIKLGFFANTRQSKKFRHWASEVLANRQTTPEEHPANALIVKMWAQVDTLHAQITERDAQITRLLAEQQQTLLAQSYQINHLQGQLIGSKDKQIDLMASVQRLKTMREKRDAHDTAVRMAREGKGNIEIAAAINRTPNHVRQILFQARAAGVLPPLPAAPMVASPQATLFTEAA